LQEKEAILTLVEITPIMQGISFKDVLEITSEYKLHPVNIEQKEDKELIEILTNSCKNFLALSNKAGRRHRGNRINEVSKKLKMN